ncbi:hypothetical protein E4U46_000501, partial [Claviceps purpurea]
YAQNWDAAVLNKQQQQQQQQHHWCTKGTRGTTPHYTIRHGVVWWKGSHYTTPPIE